MSPRRIGTDLNISGVSPLINEEENRLSFSYLLFMTSFEILYPWKEFSVHIREVVIGGRRVRIKRIFQRFSFLILFAFYSVNCLTDNREGNDFIIPLGNARIEDSKDRKPKEIQFSFPASSYTFIKNELISSVAPTGVEGVDYYSISPSLPAGLTFNAHNGEISGTPVNAFATTQFQVSAFDLEGNSSQKQISLEVKALDWGNQYFLKGSNLLANHALGVSVSLYGDTLVAGAYGDTSYAGAAYVFKRSGSAWSEEARITAPVRTNSDVFGISVAISNDTIVIGAPMEDGNQQSISATPTSTLTLANSGAAYVYRRSGTVWNLEAYLKPTNLNGGDSFGRFVAIDGDTIVVGSPKEQSLDPTLRFGNDASSDNTGVSIGAVYVFKRTGTTWAQEAYLKSHIPAANDQFGSEIGITGDTLVVGVSQDDTTASNSGAVHVFKRSGNIWSRDSYLKASAPIANSLFGVSVGISVDKIIVGAAGQNGAAYIFQNNGSGWTEETILTAPNAEVNDQFGKAVSIYGDTVAIAAPNESDSIKTILNRGTLPNLTDNGCLNSGAVYVFQKENNNWIYRSFIKTTNADPSDRVSNATSGPAGEYGSLSIYGDTIALGAAEEKGGTTVSSPLAPAADNSKTRAGAVYIFTR